MAGNGGSSTGKVNRAQVISGTFDANGLFTVSVPELESPTFTYLLTQLFTGSLITDIDEDDDGTADDLSTFGTIYDAIGVPDSAKSYQYLYGAELGGTNLKYIGGDTRLVFRDGKTDELYAVNQYNGLFDADGIEFSSSDFNTNPGAGTDTFGEINPWID